MSQEIEFKRPQWLKILIGSLSAWVCFIIMMFSSLLVIQLFQVTFRNFEIEGTLAIVLLIIMGIIAIFISYKLTKWQNRLLDKKTLSFSYIVLAILIVLTLVLIPAPFYYSIS